MTNVTIKHSNGTRERAELPAALVKVFPNGNARGTAWVGETAYRVRKGAKQTVWTVLGRAK